MNAQGTNIVVWFNKGLSSIGQALLLLKSDSGEFKTICSHTNKDFSGFEFSDICLDEPSKITSEEYIDFALSVCDKYGVDVFWPSRFQREVTQYKQQFEARGVTIITPATAETLRIIENKCDLYSASKEWAPIPDYYLVGNYRNFWYGYQALKRKHDKVCIKPPTGIFAQGFRVVLDDKNLFESIFNEDIYSIDFGSLNACLKAYGEDNKFPAKFMLMQYLSGAELSCDCIAAQGELLACVIREKPTESGKGQLIVDNPVVEQVIRDMVSGLDLDGPFNIQFKYQDGEPYLLEINPRMSGGIHISSASGINLPAMAIHSALSKTNQFKAIEVEEFGMRIHDIPTAVAAHKKGAGE